MSGPFSHGTRCASPDIRLQGNYIGSDIFWPPELLGELFFAVGDIVIAVTDRHTRLFLEPNGQYGPPGRESMALFWYTHVVPRYPERRIYSR